MRRAKVRRISLLSAAAMIVAAMMATSCADPKFSPLSPHESLLGIATEYKLLEADDVYRDAPARDLTGQSISRVTLIRLANYEALHGSRFDIEIAALKARCYERLSELETARALFARIASEEPDTPLGEDSARRVEYLDRILDVRDAASPPRDLAEAITILELQSNAWRRLAEEIDRPHYSALSLVQSEQADVRRAELIAQQRWLIADGERQAEEALRQLVANHPESHRALQHAMRLARLHRDLAEEEIALRPPETLDFDSDRFERHVGEALEIMMRVSREDGTPERLVAAREVDALLALREWVARRAY